MQERKTVEHEEVANTPSVTTVTTTMMSSSSALAALPNTSRIAAQDGIPLGGTQSCSGHRTFRIRLESLESFWVLAEFDQVLCERHGDLLVVT